MLQLTLVGTLQSLLRLSLTARLGNEVLYAPA